jgi:hypothetical protein
MRIFLNLDPVLEPIKFTFLDSRAAAKGDESW